MNNAKSSGRNGSDVNAAIGKYRLSTKDGNFRTTQNTAYISGSREQELPRWNSSSNNKSKQKQQSPAADALLSLNPRDSGESDCSEFGDDDENYEKQMYLSDELKNRLAHDDTLTEKDKLIIQRLALRKFHFPGNSYWTDYCYWICNNHPFWSVCFSDPIHPFGKRERVLNLVASLSFGLAATSGVILWFHYNNPTGFDAPVLQESWTGYNLTVTMGMLVLFVFSGPLHVMFDMGIFFIQSCPPCRPGGIFDQSTSKCGLPMSYRRCALWVGSKFAFFFTLTAVTLAADVVLLRATAIEDADGNDTNLATSIQHYNFLLLWLMEVVIANFIAFPIGSFILFSGVMGCFRVPLLGGRPFQKKQLQARMARKARRKQKKEARKAQASNTTAVTPK